MALNIDLKLLSGNVYYDFATLFYLVMIDLQRLPLQDPGVRRDLSARFYPSGRMVYLDGASRTLLPRDLGAIYEATLSDAPAVARIRAMQVRALGSCRLAAGRG